MTQILIMGILTLVILIGSITYLGLAGVRILSQQSADAVK